MSQTLPNDVARCNGMWIEDGDYHSGWRDGCETCLRRTAARPRPEECLMICAQDFIASECEYLIEPKP